MIKSGNSQPIDDLLAGGIDVGTDTPPPKMFARPAGSNRCNPDVCDLRKFPSEFGVKLLDWMFCPRKLSTDGTAALSSVATDDNLRPEDLDIISVTEDC
jgi:hypothetical protein